jgi:hypothetical protein
MERTVIALSLGAKSGAFHWSWIRCFDVFFFVVVVYT